jgi:hypothetical protein
MRTFARMSGALASIPNAQPDTTRLTSEGDIITFEDPFFGGGEAIYAKAAGTIAPLEPVVFTPVFDSTEGRYVYAATVVPNTANLGKAAAVYMGGASIASGQYGLFQVSGLTPVACSASVAANTLVGIAAAGRLGAWATTKGLSNCICAAAATTTVVKKSCYIQNAGLQVRVSNSEGWFVGMPLTGTGMGASAKISIISNDGKIVTVDVASTASGNVDVTGTYNNTTIFWNVVHLNRSFYQGAV